MTNYIGGEEDTRENEKQNQNEESGNAAVNQQFADLRLDLEILKIQRNLLRLQLLEKVGKSSSASRQEGSRQEGEEKTEGDNSSVIVYDVEDFSEDPYYEIISKPGNKLKVWLFNQ